MNGAGLSKDATATSFQVTSQPSTEDTFKSKTRKTSVNTAYSISVRAEYKVKRNACPSKLHSAQSLTICQRFCGSPNLHRHCTHV
jgi:hypothetical protein